MVHADLGLPGGLLIGSVYMESRSSADYVSTNLMRYYQLAEYLRYYGLPFIIGGDWNQSPADFVTNGFADMIPGVPLQCKREGIDE